MIPQTPMQKWLDQHMSIFDELSNAVMIVAKTAGDAGRTIDRHGEHGEQAKQSLVQTSGAATELLAVVSRARRLPSIPDEDTQLHFDAALGRWTDAAEAIALAAQSGDGPESVRGARALEAGNNEILRTAAALRRATDQPPDPRTLR
ncbi:MAG: hypothetical protein ACYDDU_18370 [Dermatophilaceae bacterium]